MRRLLSIALGVVCCVVSAFAAERDASWWSLQPIPAKSSVPGNAVDHFIRSALAAKGISPAPQASARTLVRRVYFDLIGLPPTPEEADAFVAEAEKPGNFDAAWAALIDRLLASPQHGERWARHWLDVVHYGDTHGYDKDQPRPNAWPYRDWVIRSLNADKPYARFVEEQLAGDVLFPDTRDGIEALGFISAGPWDLIGHAEVPEEKMDGQIARHLDRDDMVANTINTFTSLTVHCAQCHDHKFDPIPVQDYYGLQAVFAALDRADREYDLDPKVARQRRELTAGKAKARAEVEALGARAKSTAGDALAALDRMIAAAREPKAGLAQRFGYHSAIEAKQDAAKWVQVDLGRTVTLSQVVLHPCSDDFNGIGDGFGFPVGFRVEASDDPAFGKDVRVIADETKAAFANPKIQPVSYGTGVSGRHVRVTATKLAPRKDDFIFALAELEVFDASGTNLAANAPVTALDSTDTPERWQRANLTDSWYPGADPKKLAQSTADVAKLEEARRLTLESVLGPAATAALRKAEAAVAEAEAKLKALPAPARVYCGTVHTGSGAFAGTGGKGGKPREIHVLARGDVKQPREVATPGALSALGMLPARFDLPTNAPEGARRAALARWITSPDNPLTWRSLVNRVWQHHFGRGLVDTPNDFGKMGGLPSNPALLDWLAADFRDSGGSLKRLHRLIVTSATYRQASSAPVPAADPDNRLLWRMERRKLEAEAVRDSLLAVSGLLDLTMGGPAFQDFVIEHPEHSPHYEYHLADLADPKLHRRSVYRFLVRSKPQPWMATMDCADPSMLVDKRSQTITPLQALAQLNNQLTLVAAEAFAKRVEKAATTPEARLTSAFRMAFAREPNPAEAAALKRALQSGTLTDVCRALLNSNEFVFVD